MRGRRQRGCRLSSVAGHSAVFAAASWVTALSLLSVPCPVEQVSRGYLRVSGHVLGSGTAPRSLPPHNLPACGSSPRAFKLQPPFPSPCPRPPPGALRTQLGEAELHEGHLQVALRAAQAAHHDAAARCDLLVAGVHQVGQRLDVVGGGEACGARGWEELEDVEWRRVVWSGVACSGSISGVRGHKAGRRQQA